MLILGLLGIFFDAAVVFVMKSSLFFQIGCGHTVTPTKNDLIFFLTSLSILKLIYVYEYIHIIMKIIPDKT